MDGEFEGKIHIADGIFTVSPDARIHAEIEAREIIVRGEVIGTLQARERASAFVHPRRPRKESEQKETGGNS